MAQQWRVAESLQTLLDEVNEVAPRRSNASDGAIGDDAHATRDSDHNPWVRDKGMGVVTARDFTHDPANGCDAGKLAEHFRAMGKRGDPRIKYVIWNRQISSFIDNWQWRHYAGRNAHKHHVHVSVSSEKRYYDSRAPWGLLKPVATKEDLDPLEELMALDAEERAALIAEIAAAAASKVLNTPIPLGLSASRELGKAGKPLKSATLAQLAQWGASSAKDATDALSRVEVAVGDEPEPQ